MRHGEEVAAGPGRGTAAGEDRAEDKAAPVPGRGIELPRRPDWRAATGAQGLDQADRGAADGFHPIAEVWPLLPEPELQELADDIKANGLRNPIWRHRDGRIIDGRNRWLACRRAGVDCPSTTYEGQDGAELIAFVVSLNDKRRHLTVDQRAAIAAEIANLGHGQKKADAAAAVSQPTPPGEADGRERRQRAARPGREARRPRAAREGEAGRDQGRQGPGRGRAEARYGRRREEGETAGRRSRLRRRRSRSRRHRRIRASASLPQERRRTSSRRSSRSGRRATGGSDREAQRAQVPRPPLRPPPRAARRAHRRAGPLPRRAPVPPRAAGPRSGDGGGGRMTTPLDAARSYIRRGWAPVPIPHRQKRPVLRRLAEPADRRGRGAALLQRPGAERRGHPRRAERRAGRRRPGLRRGRGAGAVLPAADGSPVRPRRQAALALVLHVAAAPKRVEFADPEGGRRCSSCGRAAGQTVFPGSVHPSGEAIEWHEDGDPARVDPEALQAAVKSSGPRASWCARRRPRAGTTTCSTCRARWCAAGRGRRRPPPASRRAGGAGRVSTGGRRPAADRGHGAQARRGRAGAGMAQAWRTHRREAVAQDWPSGWASTRRTGRSGQPRRGRRRPPSSPGRRRSRRRPSTGSPARSCARSSRRPRPIPRRSCSSSWPRSATRSAPAPGSRSRATGTRRACSWCRWAAPPRAGRAPAGGGCARPLEAGAPRGWRAGSRRGSPRGEGVIHEVRDPISQDQQEGRGRGGRRGRGRQAAAGVGGRVRQGAAQHGAPGQHALRRAARRLGPRRPAHPGEDPARSAPPAPTSR